MRPSEVISGLRAQLAETERQRDAALGQLEAAGIEFVPMPQALSCLTGQERALVVILNAAYPSAVNKYDLLDALPSLDHARDRDVRLVDVVTSKVRRKLGDPHSIENTYGVGYRLGPALHQQLTGVAA